MSKENKVKTRKLTEEELKVVEQIFNRIHALAKRSAGRMGTGFVERQIFVNKVSSMTW